MTIKCISNIPTHVDATRRYVGEGTGTNTHTYPITLGSVYRVYGVFKMPNGSVMYLILDDTNPTEEEILSGHGAPDPSPYDAALFEVIDTHSTDWVEVAGTPFTKHGSTISFADFCSDGYYEELLDEENAALEAFKTEIRKQRSQGV